MKILYYVGTGSNKFGGLEKFNIQLFKRLLEDQHEVVVVYRRPIVDGSFKSFLDSNKIKYKWIFDSFAITGETKLTNAKRLAKIVKEEKPDLIHYNFGNLYDIALTRFRNPFLSVKAIYTAHCHTDLSRRYLRLVFGSLVPFVRKILCVSNAITNEFATHLKAPKAQTLYLGVPSNDCERNVCRRKLGFPDDTIIISNIAYHDPIKGVDILMKAVDYLKNQLGVTGFKVIQIGGSPFKCLANQLMQLFNLLDISDCFEMWGLRNDIEEIMAASDIYCQSSRSEGIPLSLMEAGMASTPIVATNVGGVSEVAFENVNALMSESEDYKALALNLQKLIKSSELRTKLGENGKKISTEKFEISTQANKLYEIYRSL